MSLVENIYLRGAVEAPTGEILPLHSSVSREEGDFIENLIRSDVSIRDTLEIGCAYGLSSLRICAGLQGRGVHTIIDPNQTTGWQSVGINYLNRAGYKFDLIEHGSQHALPMLDADGRKFDFVFIDGWHTFDHTMIDCFYATRLLRIGGYLLIDDAHYDGISRVIRHLETYPCYKRIGAITTNTQFGSKRRIGGAIISKLPAFIINKLSHRLRQASEPQYSLIALRKIADDKRAWDWQADF